ncbi:TonB-dependent receptor plug domain-containing protein [Massilia sp. TSP1-1-2]|uniref:TonB-dependent receptor plug domain-containing protein n=1 Tax=Massilia sp. TSP1-1-2 TaxID=2804649 RepID=UPI003CFA99BB
MRHPVLLALPVLLASCAAVAQSAPAPIQKVTIRAPNGLDQRRDDTFARLSVTRDDIARYGDVNVAALLRRQPGIAVLNGEVRMRGMGAGYTQILIDGEAAPPGFAIDSLAPSMIERIDIMRSGSAEFGAQAMAGTINIIMRKNHARAQRDLTAGAGAARGYLVEPSVALRWADQQGELAWSLGVELSRPNFHFDESSYETERDAAGSIINERIIRATGGTNIAKISFKPRLTWKLGGGDSLAWGATIERNGVTTSACAAETLLAGAYTSYPDNCLRIDLTRKSLRSDVTWIRTIGASKLEAKAAVNRYDRTSDFLFAGAGSTATLARRVLSDALDQTTTLSGKYLTPLGSAHSLGLGWDGGLTRRTEFRNQHDTTTGNAVPEVVDEDYQASVNRMALFAQDEWAITPRLQAYLGLRWEGLQTDVQGRTMDGRVRNSSSVFSPVATLLWKLPGCGNDQVRLSLSRTYKAPLTSLLVPRRYTTNNGNSPTNPDVRGNPELRPELAWGLDAGYEKYFGKDGVVSVSTYVRRVQGVTVQYVDPNIRPWLSTPINKGNANVAGLEADTKFAPSPKLDVHANVGYNWSELDAIPGPYNRLAEQVAGTANVGLDYRPAPAYTVGMNLNLQFGGPVRSSEQQRAYTGPVRRLDLYALWKLNETTKWRLSVSEALQQDQVSERSYSSDAGAFNRRFVETNRMVIRVVLEKRL